MNKTETGDVVPHAMAHMLDLKKMDWFLARLVRNMAKKPDAKAFQRAFGVPPAAAEALVDQWERCAMPYWGVEDLVGMITAADPTRTEKIVLRAVELAQQAGELKGVFTPADGISWAMARGYAIKTSIAEAVGVPPGTYGSPHTPRATRSEDAPAVLAPAPSTSETRPVQRLQAQEMALLESIVGRGCDPLAIPRAPNGTPGVKSLLKADMKTKYGGLFVGSTVFDKAWERLMSSGQIRYQ